MFPLIGALAGAGGSIASALIGSNSAHDQAVSNYMIALMNYQAQQEQQFYQRSMAQNLMHKQDQGFTDAMGSRTHYEPGKGWVVDLSSDAAGLQGAQNAETLKEIANDQSVKRNILNRNAGRQADEGDYANAILSDMRNLRPTNPTNLYYSLLGEGSKGVNQAYDATQHSLSLDALRTRASNAGPILTSLARDRANSLSDMFMKARTNALSLAPQLDSEAKQNDANLYNMFASRAAAMPDVSFAPPNAAQSATAGGVQAMDNAQTGLGYLYNAASQKAPQFPYQPADYSRANAIGAAGSSISSALNNYSLQTQFGDILKGLRSTQGNQGSFTG